MLTSVTIYADAPINNAHRGGSEIEVGLNGNTLQIQPTVREGSTNITFSSGTSTYGLKVVIREDDPPNFTPAFTVRATDAGNDSAYDPVLTNAGAMAPADIDLPHTVEDIRRAESDPSFRSQLQAFSHLDLSKTYAWNGVFVTLNEAYQFAERDLIVFRISWTNRTAAALYLDSTQYHIFVRNQEIPVIASEQLALRSVVYPGQVEEVWLAVQGYKLRLQNPWELRLPPDASLLQGMLPR
jgi:hypothetical protein